MLAILVDPPEQCPLLANFLHRRRRAIAACRGLQMRVRAGIATPYEADVLPRALRELNGGR